MVTTTKVSSTEMTSVVGTLKHHYIFKVYLPMYRLLHLENKHNDLSSALPPRRKYNFHRILELQNHKNDILQLQSRRNDREEIRRKLAMGGDEEYYGGERMYKKPNLQTRLQGGMNLQICFMNEATSDQESINGDTDDTRHSPQIRNYPEVSHISFLMISLCVLSFVLACSVVILYCICVYML